jgi:hypothetical protein
MESLEGVPENVIEANQLVADVNNFPATDRSGDFLGVRIVNNGPDRAA